MSKKTMIKFVLLLAALASWAIAGDTYLLRTPSSKIGAVASRHGLAVLNTVSQDLFQVRMPAGRDPRELMSDPDVKNVETDTQVWLPEINSTSSLGASQALSLGKPAAVNFYGTLALNSYVNQPAGSVVQLSTARQLATGAGVVAILDTGVDPKNPVLKSSLLTGYDFTRGQAGGSEMTDAYQVDQSTTAILDFMDGTDTDASISGDTDTLQLNQSTTAILDQSTTAILDQSTTANLDAKLKALGAAFGHGTMVAGIVHLVAPTAKILPVKVFSGSGTSTLSTVVAGIYWAVNQGNADVISMSFSSTQPSTELANAIAYAVSKGVICVASVGNDGKNVTVYPAAYGILGVGSTNNSMARSSFSDYGSDVDLAAPGEAIITTFPGNLYAAGWGTSFAAPFVSGGAALLVDIKSNTNEDQAQTALTQAIPIGQGLGAGELDLFWACWYRLMNKGNGFGNW